MRGDGTIRSAVGAIVAKHVHTAPFLFFMAAGQWPVSAVSLITQRVGAGSGI